MSKKTVCALTLKNNRVIIKKKQFSGGKIMIFVGYPKCSTSNKAQAWLDANNITYQFRHIKENNPTAQELKEWHEKSGLELKRFFNTSGLLYKEMKLKDRIPSMSDEEKYELLSSDGMLVKRPILIGDGFVLVGFKEAQWEEALKTKK